MATSVLFPNLDAALAQFEGFGIQGSVAQRQNNPGNIQSGSFACSFGGTCQPGSIAKFPNVAAGLSAEDALVAQYANSGASIQDLINAWSPPNAPGNSPQSTQNYTNFVASQLGVSPQTPLSSLLGTPDQSSTTSAPVQFPFASSNPGTTLPNTQPTSQPFSITNTLNQGFCLLLGQNSAACRAAANYAATGSPTGTPATPGGSLWGRLGGFILGMILIVGAIFLFKPAQQLTVRAGRAGGKALAAVGV